MGEKWIFWREAYGIDDSVPYSDSQNRITATRCPLFLFYLCTMNQGNSTRIWRRTPGNVSSLICHEMPSLSLLSLHYEPDTRRVSLVHSAEIKEKERASRGSDSVLRIRVWH